MFIAWKVTLECCWYVTRSLTPCEFHSFSKKYILAIFGQGYQRWKLLFFLVIFVQGYERWKLCFFLVIFGQGYQRWKFLFFLVIFCKDNNGESFCFSWSFLAKDNNGESFWFWAVLAKDRNGESFVFLGHFWPRIPTVKAFVFSWLFLAKDTNSESFVFLSHFWPRIPTMKVLVGLGHFWPKIPMLKAFAWSFLGQGWNGESLCFHGHFWPRLFLLATLAMNTNDESYVCDLRFWATSGMPLCQTGVRVRWRQSLAAHCASRSLRSGRHLMAWDCKYEYTRTLVGKRWQKSTSISYPRMEGVKESYKTRHFRN